MCFSARAVYFIHGPPYSASQEPERVSVRKDKYERTRARLDKEEGRDRVARRQARLHRSKAKQTLKIASKRDLESSLNRASVWLHAGNHIGPKKKIRNRAYFHARDSD